MYTDICNSSLCTPDVTFIQPIYLTHLTFIFASDGSGASDWADQDRVRVPAVDTGDARGEGTVRRGQMAAKKEYDLLTLRSVFGTGLILE